MFITWRSPEGTIRDERWEMALDGSLVNRTTRRVLLTPAQVKEIGFRRFFESEAEMRAWLGDRAP